jgi:hypothetical protein
MSLTGVLGAAVCAAVIGCPCVTLAQDEAIAAQEPQAAVASLTPIADAIAANAAVLAAEVQDAARPVAIEYSDAHLMRGKIHKYASFATLPLFAAEFALGQSLYNDPQGLSSTKRGVHGAVGAGLVGLFAANSVTGLWNLLDEDGKTPGHAKRLIHGLIMLAAEGGLIASAGAWPRRAGQLRYQQVDTPQHRDRIDQRRNGWLSAHAVRGAMKAWPTVRCMTF